MKALRWALLTLLTLTTADADIIYQITLNTSALIGHPAGPFSIGFEFADGSGTGDGNNVVFLSSFQFGTGGPTGSPLTFGTVSGDLSSEAVLAEASPDNVFVQSFTPGSTFTFLLDMTTNVNAGGTPDEFIMSILDNTLTPIPTVAPSLLSPFLEIDIDSANPTVQTFNSQATQPPAGGGSPLDVGVTITSPVPSTEISITASGLAYSRINQIFGGTVTIANIGSSSITGPFQIVFKSLAAGVTLTNATNTFAGFPYLTVPNFASLAPGQAATISVQFKNPSNAVINATPVVYSGSFIN